MPKHDRTRSKHTRKTAGSGTLTRGEVATRLGISVSTVRRQEGARLHPSVDENGVRWFSETEVAALASELLNAPKAKAKVQAGPKGRRNAGPAGQRDHRTRGEIAAQVFDRFEQRQSLAEIVIGVRVDPETVRELHEQWCFGLTEAQLRRDREPRLPRASDTRRATPTDLAERLAALPAGQIIRISLARYRDVYHHTDEEYHWVVELGGFHVSGPCSIDEITGRYGTGDYRVTAYGFDPPGVLWEILVESIGR